MTFVRGLAQTVAMAFWIVTAIYALGASQPLTYEQVLKPGTFPALSAFARFFPIICGAVLGFYVTCYVAIHPERRATQIAVGSAAAVWGLATVALFTMPSLATLAPGWIAEAVVFGALMLVVLVAIVDFTAAEPIEHTAPMSRHASDFFACVLAALIVIAITFVADLKRGGWVLAPAQSAGAMLSSTLLHLVIFLAVFLCLTVARALAALFASRRTEVVATAVMLGIAILLVLVSFVLPGLMPPGLLTIGVAAAFALALTVAVSARGLAQSDELDDSAVRVLSALSPRLVERSWLWVAQWAVLLAVVVALVPLWPPLIAGVGLLVLAAALRVVRAPAAGEPAVFFVLCGIVLGLYWLNRSH